MHNSIVEWYHQNPDEEEGHFYRTSIRPELAKFVIEMEEVLRENEHKSGWDIMEYDALFYRIQDEFEELKRAYHDAEDPLQDSHKDEAIQHMRKEAIDIVNFCMFLCHNYPKV